MDQITNYSQFNVPPYLLEQFKNTDVATMLTLADTQFNAFETAAYAFFAQMWLADGVGEQLDVLGIHLGLDRNGRADDLYRTLLALKARINTSGGTPEIIIDTVRFLYSATIVHYILDAPGKVTVEQNGLIGLLTFLDALFDDGSYIALDDGSTLQFAEPDESAISILNDVIPAGVGLTVVQI